MLVGEFTLARSETMEVQVRYAPVPCDCLASAGSSAVVSDGEHRIQVDRSAPDVILVDGEPVGLEGSVSMSVGTMQLEGQPGHIVVTDHLGNVSTLVFQPKWVNAYVPPSPEEIGRAPGRERVCQSVSTSVVGRRCNKKRNVI